MERDVLVTIQHIVNSERKLSATRATSRRQLAIPAHLTTPSSNDIIAPSPILRLTMLSMPPMLLSAAALFSPLYTTQFGYFTNIPEFPDEVYRASRLLAAASFSISTLVAALLILVLSSSSSLLLRFNTYPLIPTIAALNSLLSSISFLLAFNSSPCQKLRKLLPFFSSFSEPTSSVLLCGVSGGAKFMVVSIVFQWLLFVNLTLALKTFEKCVIGTFAELVRSRILARVEDADLALDELDRLVLEQDRRSQNNAEQSQFTVELVRTSMCMSTSVGFPTNKDADDQLHTNSDGAVTGCINSHDGVEVANRSGSWGIAKRKPASKREHVANILSMERHLRQLSKRNLEEDDTASAVLMLAVQLYELDAVVKNTSTRN